MINPKFRVEVKDVDATLSVFPIEGESEEEFAARLESAKGKSFFKVHTVDETEGERPQFFQMASPYYQTNSTAEQFATLQYVLGNVAYLMSKKTAERLGRVNSESIDHEPVLS